MKNITKIVFAFLALSIVLVGCDTEDYTGHSKENFTAPSISSAAVTAAASNGATFTIAGNDVTIDETSIDPTFEDKVATFNFEVTIPDASAFTSFVDLTQTGGSASGSDYSLERVRIPAGETTGYGSITFNMTGDMEGDETLELTLNAGSANVEGSEVFNFTIADDYINDNMILNFAWCNDYEHEIDDNTHTGNYGDVVDLDFVVFDENFAFSGNASGATGSCPEHVEFRGMDDGTYYVAAFMFDNLVDEFGFGEVIPIVTTYDQEHFVDESVTFYHGVNLTSDTPGDGANIFMGWIAKVEKAGHEFVVSEIPLCNWTLDMVDAWGDGWNGGYVTATIDFGGITASDYTLDSGTSGQHVISVPDGADVTFEYTAGSYNGEVSFTLTSPDGTVYTGGPGPANGIIFSGANDCP